MDVEDLGCLKGGQRVAWTPWGTLLGCAGALTAPQAVGLCRKHSGSPGCQTLNLECCPSCRQRRGESEHVEKGALGLTQLSCSTSQSPLRPGGVAKRGGRGLERTLVRGQSPDRKWPLHRTEEVTGGPERLSWEAGEAMASNCDFGSNSAKKKNQKNTCRQ